MNSVSLHGFITIVFFISVFVGLQSAQAQDGAAIKDINEALLSIDTSRYLSKDFLPNELASGASVLALGESTHGTREFYQIKDYIIRNLVIHKNVKIIAMENEFCGLIGLNHYLLDDTKPLDSLFIEFDRSGMYGIYFTKEVFQLLAWLKEYNLGRSDSRQKVQLFGLDMQDPYSIEAVSNQKFWGSFFCIRGYSGL